MHTHLFLVQETFAPKRCVYVGAFLSLCKLYAVKAQTSLAPFSRFPGSRVTTAHAHQCCIFQSYAKTVPSRMKLTMKLTMREPAFLESMTTDTWSWRVTSDLNSVLTMKWLIVLDNDCTSYMSPQFHAASQVLLKDFFLLQINEIFSLDCSVLFLLLKPVEYRIELITFA